MDLALVDIRLGNSSGIELMSELRAVRPELLCVMMTAYSSGDTAIRALRQGAYDYLTKPFTMDEFFATLARCLETVQLRQREVEADRALELRNRELQSLNAVQRRIIEASAELATCSTNEEFGRKLLQTFGELTDGEGGGLYYVVDDELHLLHSLDPGHAPPVLGLPGYKDSDGG